MPQLLFLDSPSLAPAGAFWPIVLPVAAGLAAVYLLLPRARAYPSLWGAVLGAVALLLAGWLVIRPGGATPEVILFYAFSASAVVSGTLLVTQRNPARAALSFALVVLSTCGLFLLQAAPFLMAATTIIYAGAIIVTFLFVLMLAQQAGLSDADQRSREPLLASVAGFVLLGALLYVLNLTYAAPRELDEIVGRTSQAAGAFRDLHARLDNRQGDPLSREELTAIVKAGESTTEDTYQAISAFNTAVAAQRPPHDRVLYDALLDSEAPLRAQQRTLGEQERRIQQNQQPDRRAVQAALAEAREVLMRIEAARATRGTLVPHDRGSLSEFSGPRSSRPYDQLRRDEHGQPQLPTENVAYLGRSLFTDYLLPVELGGTLLLAAAIGAIAIATRQAERTV